LVKEHKEKGAYRKYFYFAFSVAFIIAVVVLFTISINRREGAFKDLESHENEIITIESDKLTRDLIVVLSDLKYLKNAFNDDLLDSSKLDKVANNWKEFSSQRKIYDQIRFIDSSGMEKIRINRSEDASYIVDSNDLQNKCDRYYFEKTIGLNEGDFFISPLDLNIEDGVIEIPYKPVIRLSTPVFDKDGNKEGIVIINYLASDLISSFRNASNSSLFSISLINTDGYYLSNVDSNKEWGFMVENTQDINFGNYYPDEWKEIINGTKQIISENGIYFSNKIGLENVYSVEVNSKVHIEKSCWYVVSFIPRTNANTYFFTDNKIAMVIDIIKTNIVAFILVVILSMGIGVLVFFNNRYYSKIRYFSMYDSLTKAFNRGYGLDQLEKVVRSDNKKNFPLSLCYIDINGLKQVNDNLGHKEGSRLIKFVVKSVIEVIAEDDFIIRLGGDEFLIVLKGKNENQAELMWQLILDKYSEINEDPKNGFIVSVSHGILELDKKEIINDVLNDVDQKMYVEKQLIKSSLKSVLKK
jgi:diguanylate cyclase (GGDEF)-like protein